MESYYTIHVFLGEQLIFTGNEHELMEQSPEWDGKMNTGDTVTVNGQKRVIKEIGRQFPNNPSEKTVLTVKVD